MGISVYEGWQKNKPVRLVEAVKKDNVKKSFIITERYDTQEVAA
jgi:hypothetical protein